MAVQGGFVNTFYEGDSAEIHNIKLTEATLDLGIGGTAQPRPGGPATSIFWARANKNAREYGLDARSIGICFDAGQAPAGLREGPTYNVTVISKSAFDGITIGAGVTYQGGSATVVSKRAERVFPES